MGVQPRATVQRRAQARKLEFSLAVSEAAAGWWRGDADRLRQIVGNLLSNAIKFTPQGAISARIDAAPAGGGIDGQTATAGARTRQ